MHAVTKPIVLAVAGVLGLGLATAAAADTHGLAVSTLAKAKAQNGVSLIGAARGEAISTLASANGGGLKAKDAHGDLVSGVAKNHTEAAEAAHTTGAMKSNHGGFVILTAHKR